MCRAEDAVKPMCQLQGMLADLRVHCRRAPPQPPQPPSLAPVLRKPTGLFPSLWLVAFLAVRSGS